MVSTPETVDHDSEIILVNGQICDNRVDETLDMYRERIIVYNLCPVGSARASAEMFVYRPETISSEQYQIDFCYIYLSTDNWFGID